MNLSKKSLSYKYLNIWFSNYELEYIIKDTCSYAKLLSFAIGYTILLLLCMFAILHVLYIISLIYLPLIIDVNTLHAWGISDVDFKASMMLNLLILLIVLFFAFCYCIANLSDKFNKLTNIKVLNGIINKFCTKITIVD